MTLERISVLKDRRYSILAHAQQMKTIEKVHILRREDTPRAVHQPQSEFVSLVEEIRSYLVSAGGKEQKERQSYNELLNRAVLGFAEERARLLAVVNDQLIKRRVHDNPPPNRKYASLSEAIFAEVIGLNVLELILKDRDDLEEVQVVGCSIFEVRSGLAKPSPHRFESEKDVERIQQNLVLFNKDIFNPRKKWAEVMLRDGSRVTMTGFGFTAEPTLTIRFYIKRIYDLNILSEAGIETMDPRMKPILLGLIKSKVNLVVIGPTNSGKTSLIKALIREIPDHERLITIESRLELMIKRDFPHKNVIEYEVEEDDAAHSGKQAFKLALRQSPQRICHAEIRDEDANIYVRACTRGHEGSLTTVHVNALEDVPDAITDMCMLDARGMNPERLRKRITQFVTQVGLEMSIVNGQRKLVRIGEFHYEDGEVKVKDIVVFNAAKRVWEFSEHPCSDKLRARVKQHAPQYTEAFRREEG